MSSDMDRNLHRPWLPLPPRGEVAQLVEHTTENRGVAGSIPALAIQAHAIQEKGPALARGLTTSLR